MSLSSGLVTITFIQDVRSGTNRPIVAFWTHVPRQGDHVRLEAPMEDGDTNVIDGLVDSVTWRDEGVTIRVR